MSRVEAFKETQKKMIKVKAQIEPISPNIACAVFLEQIAGSLAVIADAMTEEKLVQADTAQALAELPPAQSPPISEMHAKAVRSWLVNYQVKLAELDGRYTPYEVLGWVVSDWRKENRIW